VNRELKIATRLKMKTISDFSGKFLIAITVAISK